MADARPAKLHATRAPLPFVPTWSSGEPLDESDLALLEAVAGRVVRHGMGLPCVLFLEITKPLSYVGSQTLVFFGPIVQAFLPTASYYRFSELIEDRANVETLLTLVERALETQDDERRAARARARRDGDGGKRRGWLGGLTRIVRRGTRSERHVHGSPDDADS